MEDKVNILLGEYVESHALALHTTKAAQARVGMYPESVSYGV